MGKNSVSVSPVGLRRQHELSKEPTVQNLMVRVSPLTAEFLPETLWAGLSVRFWVGHESEVWGGVHPRFAGWDGACRQGRWMEYRVKKPVSYNVLFVKTLAHVKRKYKETLRNRVFKKKLGLHPHILYMSENLNVRQPRRPQCRFHPDFGFARPSHPECRRCGRRHQASSGHGLPR